MVVNAKRRLAAVVMADVVGYSKLVGENEASTVATVNARWETVLKPIVHENGGRVVKFLGDGALMEFSSAVDAVRSALAIQNGMAAANESAADAPAIQLRVGINLGDVIPEGDDIFGDDVNIAARLEGVARPPQRMIPPGPVLKIDRSENLTHSHVTAAHPSSPNPVELGEACPDR